MHSLIQQPFRTAVLILVWGWLLFLVLAPNLLVVGASVMTRDPVSFLSLPLNLDAYRQLFDPLYLKVFLHSLYYVSKMRQDDLLMPIDRSKIEGFENLDPELVNLDVDPDNTFSVPYLWGTTGLAVDTADIEGEPVTAWEDLWQDRFEGRVMLTNDMREVFHVGLRVLGYSGNSTNPDEIEAAYEKLSELMPSVRTFNSDAPRMPYLEGETDVGMIWNGEAVMGREVMPSLEYVYPKEGIIAWLDSFVIPKTAKNPEAAHKFISFVLRPEISALISEEIGYATPNLAARDLMPDQVANNRASYPNATDMINAEFQTDIGDDALQVYAKYWEMLKSGR
jgi:spermidine/putrescine transport system substrate-binding protein